MSQAMQNEQLAMRQRLTDLYRSQLQHAAEQIQTAWNRQSGILTDIIKSHPAPESFALSVAGGYVDSVLIYNNGALAYPEISAFTMLSAEPQTPAWLQARELEFVKNNPEAAAEAYRRIARQSPGDPNSAFAWIAEARCLHKAGKPSQAIEQLTHFLGESRYREIKDSQGRSIQLNAQLFALQLMKNRNHPFFQNISSALIKSLNDYRDASIPSSQRRFLMDQLRSVCRECPEFPTYDAEELAAHFSSIFPGQLVPGRMQPTGMRTIWAYSSPDGSYIALISQKRLLAFMQSGIAAQTSVRGIRISAVPPGTPNSWFQSEKIGNTFPSWELALSFDGNDPFQAAGGRKRALYIWAGALMVAGVLILSLLLTVYLQHQIRLTHLKNDLMATVSHELKTPLASIRLLVDTLINGHSQDAQLVQEYLQMIAKENARLSSMIEGFLTFSRMEQKKAQFNREIVQTSEIVNSALQALGNRLQAPGCTLHVDLAPTLPPVIGDRDALITVFINILDNALKYSGDNKEINIRGYVVHGNVCFDIQDNGIGFPRSAEKKIFDRFYQVNRSLSRRTGGCGLGLSIVQFIVSDHNGSITTKSEPGKGSTFTVQFPASEH